MVELSYVECAAGLSITNTMMHYPLTAPEAACRQHAATTNQQAHAKLSFKTY